jgi:hypothetical protein
MEHGKVTSITFKNGGVFCDVRAIRVQTNYEDVPVLRPHSGFIQVPEQGEMVAMQELEDGSKFITNVVSKDGDFTSELKEGELLIQLDEGTKISFKETPDGNYNLNLSASGDVNIEGINFEKHSHDFTNADGSTETTEEPN